MTEDAVDKFRRNLKGHFSKRRGGGWWAPDGRPLPRCTLVLRWCGPEALTVGGYGAWRMDRDSTNALFTDNGVTCRDPCSKLGPIFVAFLAALLADGQFEPISLNNFLDFLAMCAQCEEIEREVVGTGLIWMGE